MPMPKLPLNHAATWGWGSVAIHNQSAAGLLVAVIPYHCQLCHKVVERGTVVHRSGLEGDRLLCNFPGIGDPPYPTFSDILTESAFEAAFETAFREVGVDEQVYLRTHCVVNLPLQESVAIAFELTAPGSSPGGPPLVANIPPSVRQFERCWQAWKYARKIVAIEDRSTRTNELICFLSLYPALPENDLVAPLRRDLEDAIATHHPIRLELRESPPSEPRARDYLHVLPVGILSDGDAAPDLRQLITTVGPHQWFMPPRDGYFNSLHDNTVPSAPRWLLYWTPHEGAPPFPIIKAALCDRYPGVREDLLGDDCVPPDRPGGIMPMGGTPDDDSPIAEIAPPASLGEEERNRLAEITPDSRDPEELKRDRASIGSVLIKYGSEALAWHQGEFYRSRNYPRFITKTRHGGSFFTRHASTASYPAFTPRCLPTRFRRRRSTVLLPQPYSNG